MARTPTPKRFYTQRITGSPTIRATKIINRNADGTRGQFKQMALLHNAVKIKGSWYLTGDYQYA